LDAKQQPHAKYRLSKFKRKQIKYLDLEKLVKLCANIWNKLLEAIKHLGETKQPIAS